jgi:hypothetical protein
MRAIESHQDPMQFGEPAVWGCTRGRQCYWPEFSTVPANEHSPFLELSTVQRSINATDNRDEEDCEEESSANEDDPYE